MCIFILLYKKRSNFGHWFYEKKERRTIWKEISWCRKGCECWYSDNIVRMWALQLRELLKQHTLSFITIQTDLQYAIKRYQDFGRVQFFILTKKIRTMKKEYLKPSFESLSVETVQLFSVSTRPTTVDSSESDFKEEKGIEWGEVEF